MPTRRLAVAAVAAALFLATAVLVDVGALTGIDRYAVRHWMPWLEPTHHPLIAFWRLLLPAVGHRPLLQSLLNVWVWPASVFVSALVVLAAARRAGLAILGLWLAADAVELAGKLVVERPALHTRAGVHVSGFDHSLPSGHTLRAFVVATAIAWVWRRGWPAYAWAATVPVSLVVTGDHVPTDVVAGFFAFVALAVPAWRYRAASPNE